MTYALLDDKFHSNPKILEVGNAGAGLYARALSYCGDHLTDGRVPMSWAKAAASRTLRDKLVLAHLWLPVDGGYYIPDYLTLNPSKSQVEAKRAAQREGGKRGASKRWSSNGSTHDSTEAGTYAEPMTGRDAPLPQPLSSKEEAPTRDAAPLEGTITNELLLARLAATAGGRQARDKIDRTLHGYTITEADLVAAQTAATGPGVNDRLAVTLAELTKRRRAA